MAKFIVVVHADATQRIEVEASTIREARQAAIDAARARPTKWRIDNLCVTGSHEA